MTFVLVPVMLMAAVGALCVWRVRNELRRQDRLSWPTVFAVWILYCLLTAVTIHAASTSALALDVGETVAHIAAGLLLVLGFALATEGIVEFRSVRRMSGRKTDKLVQSGVYRWSRNPQNVGWALCLAGIATWGQSLAAMIYTAEFWVIFRLYLPEEERHLERAYGEEWRRYRDRTPRYLGLPGEKVAED